MQIAQDQYASRSGARPRIDIRVRNTTLCRRR